MEVLRINFESLRQEHWSNRELENAKLLAGFVQNLMNNHDYDYVLKNYGNDLYTQYNRGIPDGFNELVRYVQNFVKRFPEYTYDVKRILVDGDYVIFHSHVTVNRKHRGNDKKGFNIIDIWEVKDGKIAKHWDAIQPLDGFMRFYFWLTGGTIKNTNGVF